MKKTIFYIWFASLLLISYSCGKFSQSITVQGRVTDYHTGLPVQNAAVFIGAVNVSGGCATADPIVTVKTDKEGYYKTSFSDPGASYTIDFDISKDNYVYEYVYGEIDLSKHQTDFTINRQLKPETGILFKVEDIAPFDYIKNFSLKYLDDTFYNVNLPLTFLQAKRRQSRRVYLR